MVLSLPPAAHFEEVYEFFLTTPTPDQILTFRPSSEAQERIEYLLSANRDGVMTPDERNELDEYLKVEHFMRMLKARARDKVTQP